MADEDDNPPYEYQWSTGETNDSQLNLSSGSYAVGVTDSRGTPEGSIIPPPVQEQTEDSYLNSIIDADGLVDSASAMEFMAWLAESVNVGTEEEPNWVTPNLDAFMERFDGNQDEMYVVLTNINEGLYFYRRELMEFAEDGGELSAQDQQNLQECMGYEGFLQAPAVPEEEGAQPGFGIPMSEAEMADIAKNAKTGLETFFNTGDANLVALLEKCGTLDNEATRANLNMIIARITGQQVPIAYDETELPPETPIAMTEEGLIIYTNHALIKGKGFKETLPPILSYVLGMDEITPEYIAELLSPFSVGTNVSANTPDAETPEEEQSFLPLLLSIFSAKSEEEAMASAFQYFQQNMSGSDGMMGMISNAVGMENMMAFGQKAISILYGFCQSIKGMLGISNDFNAVASNEAPSATTRLQQNGQDITTTVGQPVASNEPAQDRQRVANVTLPS